MQKQLKKKQNFIDRVLHDQLVRREVAKQDILWFFKMYLPHYITYPIAPFHNEILKLLQEDEKKLVAITAFRNSGKSTLCSLLAPMWYITGVQQKKYIVIVCQTQERAKQLLSNIRKEFESIGLLTSDFGPFSIQDGEWTANAIVLHKYNARITVISTGEGMRGLRHRQYRPDVIIIDDVEDVQSAKQRESRDRLWQFINGELIPAGTTDVKVIIIGNLVHEDSLMMRLKIAIENKIIDGTYMQFPLYDEAKHIQWPGKFTTFEQIEILRKRNPSEADFLREYLLKIIPQGNRIIYPEDIHYYDPEISDDSIKPHLESYVISIDPAVSEKESADNTGIIVYEIYRLDENLQIRILPNPINKRLTVPGLIEVVKQLIATLGSNCVYEVFIEGGSTQKGIYQMLKHEGIHVKEVSPQGKDKIMRLSMAKSWIAKGIFLFPNKGAEELITQLQFFGVERYDDLVDSLTLFFLEMLEQETKPKCNVAILKMESLYKPVIVR